MNRKQIASTNNPDYTQQCLYIAGQKDRFAGQGLPVIRVDAKKKELIGNFKNPGASWVLDAIVVKDRDFRSEANALVTAWASTTCRPAGLSFLGRQRRHPGLCGRGHFAVVASGRFEAIPEC